MTVSALIVTYGDRFSFVEKVVNACIGQGVDWIYVVSNGCSPESLTGLKKLDESVYNLKLISLTDNFGSSGGFKVAIEKALLDSFSDFFWFLDDDNLPESGALDILKTVYSSLTFSCHDPVLYSYRGSTRKDDYNAVFNGVKKRTIPNSFCGFHLSISIQKAILGFFRPKIHSRVNFPIIRTHLGPYGGLFVSTNNIRRVGFPNEMFFVYADDHEYTSRFEELTIDQFLVYQSQLNDLDISFASSEGYFGTASSDLKIYYSLRNHVYFGKRFVTNYLRYYFNKWCFIALICVHGFMTNLSDMPHFRKRYSLVMKAFRDGEEGRLGKI